jgi:RNA polymerase sigma-70 factor (ECF subfamily)
MAGKTPRPGVANSGVPRLAADTVERAISARPAAQPDRDADSRAWLASLRADDLREREDARARLHALLLGAARFEVRRRAATAPHVAAGELDDLAHQSAHDALVAVLAKLDDFRGDSRFTTWAYKFALLEAGVKMRRRAWQHREVTLAPESWPALADPGASPDEDAGTAELLRGLRDAIAEDLTAHQRAVLVAVTLNDVPIDVLAERMGSTRGALYKTLHDARRRLRTALAARGLEAP